MDAWSTVIGQRAMESIISIARDIENLPTLRDQFAMNALAGLLSTKWGLEVDREKLAKECYEVADAMLEARKKK